MPETNDCSPLYEKKLCMSQFWVQRSRFDSSHYYHADAGKNYSSFGFLVKGSVTLSSMGKKITMGENSLFYLPVGIRYSSVWTGTPEIEYYSMHIIADRPMLAVDGESCPMQYIPELSNGAVYEKVRRIFDLFATDERVNKIRALGIYYDFFADVLPYMKTEPRRRSNPALQTALDYIESHYTEDFEIEHLASVCCVSPSRLHHLFRDELNTTPIRYRNEVRVEKAAAALREGKLSADAISEACGFHSTTYFREIFRDFTGLTPAEYRKTAGQ